MFQINELYEEVLHEIMHCVGSEKTCMNQKSMIAFAREVFKIDENVHESIYRAVVEKEVSAVHVYIPITFFYTWAVSKLSSVIL